MGNFISNSAFSRFVVFCTLGTFTATTIIPLHLSATPQINVNLNDVNFGIRIEKLIEKAKKYFNEKNSRKLTDVMFDIKNEIEGYTGQKINIENSLDKIEHEAKSRGQPVPKDQMKEMRRRLKKANKRHNHKAMHMANCIEYELPFNAEEESLLYVMAKSSHGKDKDDKEVVLPLRVTIGVTMSLVGIFLYVVPLPICKLAAPWVLETGIAFLIDQGVTEWEDRQKEKKK